MITIDIFCMSKVSVFREFSFPRLSGKKKRVYPQTPKAWKGENWNKYPWKKSLRMTILIKVLLIFGIKRVLFASRIRKMVSLIWENSSRAFSHNYFWAERKLPISLKKANFQIQRSYENEWTNFLMIFNLSNKKTRKFNEVFVGPMICN